VVIQRAPQHDMGMLAGLAAKPRRLQR